MLAGLPKDIVILVSSENAATERRVTPSWTISTLKMKLEPVTGVPPLAQRLSYQLPESLDAVPMDNMPEDIVQIGSLGWQQYTKVRVDDTRPPGMRENYTDTSKVEKYEMPEEDYAKLSDSVLAWKKRNQLGRFDPKKAEEVSSKQTEEETEVELKGISVGARCLVGDSEADRRGEVAFVGTVEKIPQGGIWIGIKLDEPTGKNDGTIDGVKYFDAEHNHGLFVRPGRITVGNYPPKSIDDEDVLEEI